MRDNLFESKFNSPRLKEKLERAKGMYERGISLQKIAEKLFGCKSSDELEILEKKAYENMKTYDQNIGDSEWSFAVTHKNNIIKSLEKVINENKR